MSEYYEFVGSLTFRSAKDAKEGHAALRGVHDGVTTFFWKPNGHSPKHTDLVVDGATLHFAWKGFSGGVEPYYKTLSILEELARKASPAACACKTVRAVRTRASRTTGTSRDARRRLRRR